LIYVFSIISSQFARYDLFTDIGFIVIAYNSESFIIAGISTFIIGLNIFYALTNYFILLTNITSSANTLKHDNINRLYSAANILEF